MEESLSKIIGKSKVKTNNADNEIIDYVKKENYNGGKNDNHKP